MFFFAKYFGYDQYFRVSGMVRRTRNDNDVFTVNDVYPISKRAFYRSPRGLRNNLYKVPAKGDVLFRHGCSWEY